MCLWSNCQYARKLILKPRLSYSKSASFPHKNIKMWEMLMLISIFEASFLLNLIFNQLLRSAESISVSNLSSCFYFLELIVVVLKHGLKLFDTPPIKRRFCVPHPSNLGEPVTA